LIRPPPLSTLFPYTTLFRSWVQAPERLGEAFAVVTGLCERERRDGRAVAETVEQVVVVLVERSVEGERLLRRGERGAHRGSAETDRKSTRLNSSHEWISYAV